MTKSTEEILRKAVQMKPDFVEYMRKQLDGFGDVVDQLRVLGHLGQAMVDLSQDELSQIKLQMDEEARSKLWTPDSWKLN